MKMITTSIKLGNNLTGKAARAIEMKQVLMYQVIPRINCINPIWSGGYQIVNCLPFSLYLLHSFRSESEQPYRNRVNELTL